MDLAAFSRFIPEAKDLIMKMLIKDPLLRIKPEEALKHGYFIKTGMISEPIPEPIQPEVQPPIQEKEDEQQLQDDQKEQSDAQQMEFTLDDKIDDY